MKIIQIKNEIKEIINISKKELKQILNESEIIDRYVDNFGINYVDEFYKNKRNQCYYILKYDLKKKKYVDTKGVNL